MNKSQTLSFWSKTLLIAFSLLLVACSETPQATTEQNIISSDIDNFWTAYDKIISTKDTVEQHQYLQKLFLDKGSLGLAGIIKARNYTPKEYLQTINDYPLFWESMRANTLKAKQIAADLELGMQKLKLLYPELKPAKIYLTIGALRTNGTVMDSMLLIGTELAMGDSNVVTTEFPKMLSHLPAFFKNNPIQNVVALNIHEYIHTQQNAIGGYDLLSQSVFEGVAEFVPVIALQKESSTASVTYGKAHDAKVKARFSKELFSPWIYNWIWNSPDNEFGIRDLGYYVGYAIAEKYYEQSKDKKKAIKELIELDYQSKEAIEQFVDKTGYFDKTIVELKQEYEANRPRVLRITEFENGAKDVDPALTKFTIEFSHAIDDWYRSTDFGELGKDHFPAIKSIEFSKDGKSATYHLKGLEAKKQYQMLITSVFRSRSGASPLVPYVVEFWTGQ